MLQEERARQDEYQRQAGALQETSRKRYDDFGGQQNQRANDLSSMFQQAAAAPRQTAAPEAAIPTSANASNVVTQEIDRQRGAASQYGNQQTAALAGLRSFGDMLGTTSRGQARDAGEIGQVGNFMRGSSDVSKLELQKAGMAGGGLRTIGDLLGGLGKIGVTAGLSGGMPGLSNMFSQPTNILSSAAQTAPTGVGAYMPSVAGGSFSPYGGRY